MRTTDIIRRASNNLRQARARTVLTSLAIAVGSFTIALAMAAGMGGRAFTDDIISSSGDMQRLTVYPKIDEQGSPASTQTLVEYQAVEKEQPARAPVQYFTHRDKEKIQALDGVEKVYANNKADLLYISRGEGQKKFVSPMIMKVDRTEPKLAAGSLHNTMLSKGEVMIPQTYLAKFGFKDAASAIGQPLIITVQEQSTTPQQSQPQTRDFRFTIAAVDKRADTSIFYLEGVSVSPEDMSAMYNYQYGEAAAQQYDGLAVLASHDTNMAELSKKIEAMGYTAFSVEDSRKELLKMINVAQWSLAGVGALAIVASIFGIINTQYISVLERTQQIGLMKALGARRKDISRLFRYEAAWVGFLGGAIGVALAFLVTFINPLLADPLKFGPDVKLLRMDWLASALLIAALMAIAVVSGYFPARKASKLDPVEALRAE